MSTNARKRLMRDFKRIQNEPPVGVQAAPLGTKLLTSVKTGENIYTSVDTSVVLTMIFHPTKGLFCCL